MLKVPTKQRGFKKERILRVLLSNTHGMTKYRIAKEAGVSEPWCREYTSRLENKGLISDTKVIDHEGLYDEWERIKVGCSSLKVSFQDVFGIINDNDLTYALTTYKAENLYQGFLFPSMIDIYIKKEQRDEWLEIIRRKGLIGGGNTRIRITDEHVFYGTRMRDGYFTVSLPQLIIDLRLEGGHCWEAADLLIKRFHKGVQDNLNEG